MLFFIRKLDGMCERLRRMKWGVIVLVMLPGFVYANLMPRVCLVPGYVPSDSEIVVFESIVSDDMRNFRLGRETVAANKLNVALISDSASEVARAYAKNRTEADRLYSNKRVLLSGEIAAVYQETVSETSVVFAGTGTLQVRAQLKTNSAVLIRSLKQGDNVVLGCMPAKSVKGGVQFKDCISGEEMGTFVWNTLRGYLADFYQGKRPADITIPTMAINIALFAQVLPPDSGCPDDMARCDAAFEAMPPIESHMTQAVIRRFQDAGLNLDHYAELHKRQMESTASGGTHEETGAMPHPASDACK
ncbi:OB-fold protein [Paraburkholderia hayleyella]|uniref:OB-fold protein n=1 Tax=Paraburkholderia hayleyella TaxID=2152889 RepID=UPI001290C0FC|nr:hypothetical protein [Paraburkholderia hayleyella]